MSSAVAGYKQTLGADAPPACYDDVNHAQCLFIVGSNTAYAHPILFRRIEDAKARQPGAEDHRLRPAPHRHRRHGRPVPADPARHRRDAVPRHAAHHAVGRLDRRRLTSRPTPAASTRSRPRCATTRPTWWRRPAASPRTTCSRPRDCSPPRPATLSLYCQGLNQSSSGTAKNAALINLHLATGQIGKPGAGPFSLTGQPNAMGGREVGGLANLLSAPPRPGQPAAPRRSRRALGRCRACPRSPARPRSRCSRPPPTARSRPCGSPAPTRPSPCPTRPPCAARCSAPSSWWCRKPLPPPPPATTPTCCCRPPPGAKRTAPSPTASAASAACAPAVPAAPGAESRATTGRSRWISRRRLERNCRLAATAADPFAVARDRPSPVHPAKALFAYDSPESIWNEHRESTRGRDLDITGLSYAMLDAAPQQWPLPEGATGRQGAPVRRRHLPHRRRQGAFRRRGLPEPWPSRANRATRFR